MEYKTYPCLNLGKVSHVSKSVSDPGLNVMHCNVSILWSWSRGCSWHLWRHNDIITMETVSAFWPFVKRDHLSHMVSLTKDQWCWALVLSLMLARTNDWTNKPRYSNLRRINAHVNHCNKVKLLRRVGTCMVTWPGPATEHNVCRIWIWQGCKNSDYAVVSIDVDIIKH